MNIYFLDSDFKERYVLDIFKSLIWVKRYYTAGDFELYTPATAEITLMLVNCPYLSRDDDNDSVMIVENIKITTDVENGNFYTISGRSLESILARRIVSGATSHQFTIETDDAAEVVYQLVKINIGESAAENRTVENFIVDETFTYPADIKMQITGKNLADAISDICQTYGFGYRVTLNDDNIVFALYAGSITDVTFSAEFDNLINSDYEYNGENLKNVAYIAGEGEGTARKWTDINSSAYSGLDRRELFVDARDISSNSGEISENDYYDMLATRGAEKLAEQQIVKAFSGNIEPRTTYQYKKDYNLGDIVTVDNGYGVTAAPRIIEIIECWDDTGYKVVPTFEKWEV
jgi:hypothetical protein